MLANKLINELFDEREQVSISHSKLIKLSVILYRLLLAILLLNEEKRERHRVISTYRYTLWQDVL